MDSTSSAMLEEAMVALRAGNYVRALNLTDQVEARQPGLTESRFVRGQVYYDLALYDRAAEYWTQARDAEPEYWLWHHNLGDVAFKQNKFERAASHYRRAAELDPNPASLHGLASAYWELGKKDSTGQILQRALDIDPTYAPIHLSLSNYAEEFGQIEDAVIHAHHALAIDSVSTEYHLAAGILDAKTGEYEEAVAHLQLVLRTDPSNYSALYNVGQTLQRLRRGEEAKKYLESAEVARQQDRALTLLREAVANNPMHPGNQLALAQALQGVGRIDEALRAYKAADLLSPGNTRLQLTIATLHLQRGDLNEAIRRFQAIMAADSTVPEVWLNLGLAYIRMDSTARAYEIWRQAGRRFPDHPSVQQVLARIGPAGG